MARMTKLQRYVFLSFLSPLCVGYGAMAILVVLSEFLERLDKMMAGKTGILLVIQYLAVLLPVRSIEIFPVAALLATLFSLGNLSHRREIIAAMAVGIHPWRLVQPLIWMGLALSMFAWGL